MDKELSKPVQFCKGVGPFRAGALSKIGINSVYELLSYYPAEWEDRSRKYSFDELYNGLKAAIEARVISVRSKKIGRMLGLFEASCSYDGGFFNALWFRNISYRYNVFETLEKKIKPGCCVLLYGLIEKNFAEVSLKVEEYEVCSGAEEKLHSPIVPHYRLTEGIDRKFFRRLMRDALDEYSGFLEENLPESIISKHGFMGKKNAVRAIHFPESLGSKDSARRRLAYEELFFLEYALLGLKKANSCREKKHRCELKKNLLTPFKRLLGFEFTGAQKKVINEIFGDMMGPSPMNRLLEGDVGSGKTVVALSAVLLAVENGCQACFMAPTEILAEQHLITIKNFVGGLGVKVALLTSSTAPSEKKKILSGIAEGRYDIVVGTHALIQKNVRFKNLSLVVIDEQHRFGVSQRLELIRKSRDWGISSADTLVMTATPIPRTLALTLYGDLDVSILGELPKGRKKIHTLMSGRQEAYARVKAEVLKGYQAYVVFPLVEESDALALKAAVQESEFLAETFLKGLKLGLLHGRMSGAQKERTMKLFVEGKIDVLVTTTVIEVGIDVPNASAIVIENADRFGLATLHQLRGRVGRGSRESLCILVGKAGSLEAKQRFEAVMRYTDGFKLGEIDLALRGPGEFFGLKQHGLPELKIADLALDRETVEAARRDADEIINARVEIPPEDTAMIQNYFARAYGAKKELAKA